MSTAVSCSRPSCGNRTIDSSGRCRHHRSDLAPGTSSIPPLPSPAPVAGVHPTGGYDEVRSFVDCELYTLGGLPHRLDGPAVVGDDGSAQYYVHGVRHRDDGPAMIEANGSIRYYRNGEIHRDDGPAMVSHIEDGATIEAYYVNGERHREGAPAVIGETGEQWYRRGKLHREDGPAASWPLGGGGRRYEWWLDGTNHSPSSYFVATGRALPDWVSVADLDSRARDGVLDIGRLIEAYDSGAPFEWCYAFASAEEKS